MNPVELKAIKDRVNQKNPTRWGIYYLGIKADVVMLLSEVERLQSELDELKRTIRENEWLLAEEDAEREYLEICREKEKNDDH